MAFAVLAPAALQAQEPPERWLDLLPAVVPGAHRFGEREGDPPVVPAFGRDASGAEALVGYAFLTSDVPPEQLGFDGPIEALVGIDLEGTLTGVRIVRYAESLRRSRGDFLARPGFQEQFAGKTIADAFQVRRDVDGITGATITVDATARGIRNAARRVAAARGLGAAPATGAPRLGAATVTPEELGALSWNEMVARGLVAQLLVLDEGRTAAELWLLPLREEASAGVVVGEATLEEVRARAGPVVGERHLLVAGVDGPLAGALNLGRLAVVQAGDTTRVETDEVLLFGPPREGKLDGQVRFLRVLLLDRAVDLSTPLTFVLDLRPGLGLYAAAYPDGGPEGSAPALAAEGASGETILARTLAATSWTRVAALAALLALAMAAFLTRRERLRWAALLGTLLYLGFADKGFLSISHLNAGLRVGPVVYLSDAALLLLVAFTVLTTLLWGRVFCGYLCPFGALQDVLERVVPRKLRRELPEALHRRGALAKYGVLALVVAPAALGSQASLFQYFEPFGTVFFPSTSVVLWTIAAAMLAASAVVPRFYCRYACPLGAALALGSVLSPLRIRRVEQCGVCKVCELRCPTRAIRGASLDFKECVRCGVCEVKLATRAGVCRHDMAVVRSRLVRIETRVRTEREV